MKLWDALDLNKPPALTLAGYRGGHFNPAGTQITAVTSYNRCFTADSAASANIVAQDQAVLYVCAARQCASQAWSVATTDDCIYA